MTTFLHTIRLIAALLTAEPEGPDLDKCFIECGQTDQCADICYGGEY
jgi:hypothetical protein